MNELILLILAGLGIWALLTTIRDLRRGQCAGCTQKKSVGLSSSRPKVVPLVELGIRPKQADAFACWKEDKMNEKDKNLKHQPVVPNIDPVDHEDKIIKKPEDFVTDKPELKKDHQKVSDVMKDDRKQVSAEIDRSDLADSLKDKGC